MSCYCSYLQFVSENVEEVEEAVVNIDSSFSEKKGEINLRKQSCSTLCPLMISCGVLLLSS